jgi:hypothetical protein
LALQQGDWREGDWRDVARVTILGDVVKGMIYNSFFLDRTIIIFFLLVFNRGSGFEPCAGYQSIDKKKGASWPPFSSETFSGLGLNTSVVEEC